MQFDMVENLNKEISDSKKSKPRIYDENGFSLRGSCVVWDSVTKNSTLLIKNKKNKWCIPGGGIEDYDETFQIGALRELKEEAGIIGIVTDYVGNFKDSNGKNKHSTFVWNVIPLKKLECYKENYRERRWFTYMEALEILSEKPLHQDILRNSKETNQLLDNSYFKTLKRDFSLWCQTTVV